MKNQFDFIRKLLTQRKLSQGGFTLVEILVAAAMLGVVSLGVMQLTKNVTRTGKRMAQDSTALQIRMELAQILQNETACMNSIGGLTVDGAAQAVAALRDENNRVIVRPGQILGTTNNAGITGGPGAMTVLNITARGFRDLGSNNYGLVGPPFVAESWVGPPPGRMGIVDIRVIARKGSNAALTDQQVSEASIGSANYIIDFRVRAAINGAAGAGVIQSCFGNANAFVEAACIALGGVIDNATGRCAEITILNLNDGTPTDAGIEVDGLHVDDFQNNASVGTADLQAPGPAGQPNGGLLVGNTIPAIGGPVPQSGDATINRSIGVGVNAPGLVGVGAGDAWINSGLNVGTLAFPIGDGAAVIENSLGVGMAAPAAGGNVSISNLLSVGGTTTLGNENTDFVNLVGTIQNNDAGVNGGNVFVDDSFVVTQTTTLGDNAADFVNLVGVIRNNTGVNGGNVTITDNMVQTGTKTQNGNFNLTGNQTITGNLVVNNGFITTNRTAAQIGPMNAATNNRFVTKDWVYQQLTSTFDDAQRRAIVRHILQATVNEDDFTEIKTVIGNQTIANVLVDNSECADAAEPMVIGLTRVALGPVGDINRVQVKAECVDTASTCVGPVCLTDGHEMSRPPSSTTHTTGAIFQNVSGQCIWWFDSNEDFWSNGPTRTRRDTITICPFDYPTMNGLHLQYATLGGVPYINQTPLCCKITAQD